MLNVNVPEVSALHALLAVILGLIRQASGCKARAQQWHVLSLITYMCGIQHRVLERVTFSCQKTMTVCRLNQDVDQLKAKLKALEQLNVQAASEQAASLAELRGTAESQCLAMARREEHIAARHSKALSAECRAVRKLTNSLGHSNYEPRT